MALDFVTVWANSANVEAVANHDGITEEEAVQTAAELRGAYGVELAPLPMTAESFTRLWNAAAEKGWTQEWLANYLAYSPAMLGYHQDKAIVARLRLLPLSDEIEMPMTAAEIRSINAESDGWNWRN